MTVSIRPYPTASGMTRALDASAGGFQLAAKYIHVGKGHRDINNYLDDLGRSTVDSLKDEIGYLEVRNALRVNDHQWLLEVDLKDLDVSVEWNFTEFFVADADHNAIAIYGGDIVLMPVTLAMDSALLGVNLGFGVFPADSITIEHLDLPAQIIIDEYKRQVDELAEKINRESETSAAAIINNSVIGFDHTQTLTLHDKQIDSCEKHINSLEMDVSAEKSARVSLKKDIYDLTVTQKKIALAISSALETDRAFRRENGCDGVHRVKAHAGVLIDDETYGQTHDVSYSAINHHNHWDTSTTNGIAQFSVSVAGVYIQMRHTDYSRRQPKPKGSNYLETEVIDYPGVPLDITGDVSAQVEKAKQYILAREDERLRAGLANFKDAHQVFMAYIEVYPERLSASELETFVGTRHQLNASNEAEAVDEFSFWDWTGLQDPQQNYSNFPLLVHGFDDNGEIAFGSWKARVCFAPIGSYEDYPLHEICTERDDIMTRLRSSNYDNSVKTRFQVKKNKLREMIEKIPGLDGYGADIKADFSVGGTSYQVDKFGTQSALNAAYYHDRYALKAGDADGRSHKYLGFSRSSFVAHNTREEILPVRTGGNIKRISIMHPLELVVVDFRQHWNPMNIQNMTGLINYGSVNPKTTQVGRTEQNPLSGYMDQGLLFYKTPAELYSGVASVDPADTASAFLWIKDGNGAPKRVSPSGVPPFLPPINGITLRQRWFIYDVYDEGSLTHREMLTRFAQQDTDLAAAVINNSLAEFNNSQSIDELSYEIKSLTAHKKYLKEKSDNFDIDLMSMSSVDNDMSAAIINNAVDILTLKNKDK